jgi:hypothetical protein
MARDLTGQSMYVRKETIAMAQGAATQEPEIRNEFSLDNIKDWDKEELPADLHEIAQKWKTQGLLRRTKSSGVLAIDREDMKKSGRRKASGRNWDQYNEGHNVATDMATESHAPFSGSGQWRIKAVDQRTQKLVGVLIVENQTPLYLRWLIGSPEIKGGGSVLLAAVKKLLLQSPATSVEVTSAYSAKSAYTKSGFKEKPDEEAPPVLPGQEFTLSLSKEDVTPQSIPPKYEHFVPERYAFNGEESSDESDDDSVEQW